MEAVLGGGLVRAVQAFAAGAPTLLVGFVVAGVFRHLLGPAGTRRLFGGGTMRSLLQSWAMGMLLPVCSLGVIPVAYEMRRAGVSGGAILAFMLTAPLFNPLSLLYGLTLSAPAVIVTFALCSLVLVTVIGLSWNRIFGQRCAEWPHDTPVTPGLTRMMAVLVEAARAASGPTLWFCLVGLAGTIILNFIFPKGSLGNAFAHDDPTAPLLMLVLAPLAYATPLTVMMQIGSMFVHGNSVGAAYTLLAVGAGLNLGTIAWAWHAYGGKETVLFITVFAVVVTGIAYAIEGPLHSAGALDTYHTHAFDIYSCPFPAKTTVTWEAVRLQLREAFQPYQLVSLVCVAALGVAGAGLQMSGRDQQVDAWLQREPTAAARSFDVAIPAPLLGGIALTGLIVLSGLGCYVYYPPPSETIEDMVMSKVNYSVAVRTGNGREAVREIELYDALTRKLQVGHFLRSWELDEFQQTKAKVLRGRLEQLKDLVEAGNFDEARMVARRVSDAHRRCREAFGL